jgi:cystathionine beta-lyase/cystathionine gamma-synthase
MRPRGHATDLIHRGEVRNGPVSPLTTPVYETTTFVFDSADEVRRYQEGRANKYLYSRYENPTVVATETKIAALDGADMALVFSSGMAASTTCLMSLVRAGDEVVCSAALYGGTLHLLKDLLANFGVRSRCVPPEEFGRLGDVVSPETRVVWFESPVNPTLRCLDIRAVASVCRERGIVSVIDNTFASPINQRPLSLGVDLAMQSATKYLNGHSDVTAGAIAGPVTLMERVARTRRVIGTVLDPYPAYALGRGLKTLPVRIARQNASAEAVATWLSADPRVSTVFYPGLESHPDHAIARGQMTGFGGMVCFDLGGSYERAAAAFDRLEVIGRAASLGGVESIVSLPVLTSHYGFSPEALERAGVTAGMVRLSVGLEDPQDLIADLDQALG